VFAYNALGFAELSAGRPREAVAALEQALHIARETQTGEEGRVLSLAHLAEAHSALGDATRARELAESAVGEASRHRVVAAECYARLAQARILAGSGDARALDRTLALVEETGAACYAPFVHLERARLARHAGDQAACGKELRVARRLFTEMGATARAAQLGDDSGR
jgi:ATP/maltotriose-dependent transcriptional regulator MalT